METPVVLSTRRMDGRASETQRRGRWAEIRDQFRVDFKGKGTHAATLRGMELLRAAGIQPKIAWAT